MSQSQSQGEAAYDLIVGVEDVVRYEYRTIGTEERVAAGWERVRVVKVIPHYRSGASSTLLRTPLLQMVIRRPVANWASDEVN